MLSPSITLEKLEKLYSIFGEYLVDKSWKSKLIRIF